MMRMKRYLTTMRGQLITSVMVVHAILMTLFVADLIHRQKSIILAHQLEHAIELASTMAYVSSGWIASKDVAGLQEIIGSQRSHQDIVFALLTNSQGMVLAHSDRDKIGKFITPPNTIESPIIYSRDFNLVDVSMPVKLGNSIIGWARVGLNLTSASAKLDQIMFNGIIYAVIAIVLGGLTAYWMGTWFTAKLLNLRKVAETVRAGNTDERVPDLGDCEVGALGRDFNEMLDQLNIMQHNLSSSEERFSLVVAAANIGVWDRDLKTEELYFSREWKAQLGYAEDELNNDYNEWAIRVHPEDFEATVARLRECMNDPEQVYFREYRMRHKDETYRWISSSGKTFRDENGEPYRMLGSHLDVTERKESEESQSQYQRQIQHMQKLEAIGLLTGGIAHDFNNILCAILGYADLSLRVNEELGSVHLGQYLHEIQRSGERAKALIAKMLTFARGGQGKAELVATDNVVRDMVGMLQATLPSSIMLVTTIEPDIPRIMLDPVGLQQCITNLCVNARDALNGQGHIAIDLRVEYIERSVTCQACHDSFAGDYVVLSVSDDGPGIPPEIMNRIFDPFFTTKEVGKGTGMGLSVVMGIVKQAGGHACIDNRPGAGVKFSLYYPIDLSVLGSESQTDSHFLSRRKLEREMPDLVMDNRRQHVKRILVIDDEVALGQFLASALQLSGYKVEVFCNPETALRTFCEDPMKFDLILTDQTMPGITGLELVSRVRKVRPDMRVVLMSGYSESVDSLRAEDLGVQYFLPKPMSMVELVHTVGLALS